MAIQVFVQADSDLMLARRIARDTKERGRSVEGILEQYASYNGLMLWLMSEGTFATSSHPTTISSYRVLGMPILCVSGS